MHIIVRNGAINVYRFFVGLLIRINKKWDNLLGKIDPEKFGTKNYVPKFDSLSDCSDNEDDVGAKNELKNKRLFCDIDGDIASTDDEGESDGDESKSKLINCKTTIAGDPTSQLPGSEIIDQEVNFTSSEWEVLRSTVLALFSHQNSKGNTILHEAVLEDRNNFIENIKWLQMVRQDIKNNKLLTFEELKDYLSVNSFIRRYQAVDNEIRHRAKKKRFWRFFDADDEDEEESMSIIKMQKIVTPEERRNNEMRALMKFVYFFMFFLIALVAYLVIKSVYSRSKQFFPPPKLM